jgi:uncharacterized protein (TIGR02001 family)
MKNILSAISICAAAVAFAQDNGAAAQVAAQNTGAAATQQAVAAEPQEKVAESIADLDIGSKVLEKFSASVTVGYESEYVFRGIKYAGNSVCPQVDLGYNFGAGFAAYVGYWGNYEVGRGSDKSSSFQESDLYAGLTYTIKNLTFDVGVINYIYPEDDADEWEWKAAVSYDTVDLLGDFNVCPSIAYFYNNKYSVNTLEGGLSYSAPVMKWINGDNWLSIDSSALVGYICRESQGRALGDYTYFQLKSDAVFSITSYCSYSIGIRYSLASANADWSLYDGATHSSSRLWFGTSLSFGF